MRARSASASARSKLRRSRARRGEGELLRSEILDATEQLLIRAGDADAVSIRAIADAVGVTPPSIYMHFQSKEELVLQVCERQFQALETYADRAMEGITDPVEALKAMGHAYVRFGLDHPEQYRFIFMARTPEWAQSYVLDHIGELSGFSKLVAAVERCVDSGAFEGDAFTIACGLWMAMHGTTSLLISKSFFPWPDELVSHCIESACRGLSAP